MRYLKDFKKLCTPASVYLFINVIIFIAIAIQNFGNTTQYCVGQYKCRVPNTFSMFLFKAVYILFWTFILNAICKAGYTEVSWFMVLLPIILLFIIIGIIILNSDSISIFEGNDSTSSTSVDQYEVDQYEKAAQGEVQLGDYFAKAMKVADISASYYDDKAAADYKKEQAKFQDDRSFMIKEVDSVKGSAGGGGGGGPPKLGGGPGGGGPGSGGPAPKLEGGGGGA